MKELNEIDEMFRENLSDFRPDASHLDYNSISQLMKAKTAATTTTKLKMASLFGKSGLGIIIGTAAIVTVTGTALLLNNTTEKKTNNAIVSVQNSPVEAIQTKIVSSPSRIQNTSLMKDKDDVKNSEENNVSPQTTIINTVHIPKTFIASQVSTNTINPAPKQNETQISQLEFTGNPPLSIERKEEITSSVVPGTVDSSSNYMTSIVESDNKKLLKNELKTKQDSLMTIAETKIDSASPTSSMATENVNNETVNSGQQVMYYASTQVYTPRFLYPKHQISFRFGLGFVPENQNGTTNINYSSEFYDPYYIYYPYVMISEKQYNTIKQENNFSLGYQRAFNNNLLLGVNTHFTTGGWLSNSYQIYLRDSLDINGVTVTDNNGLPIKIYDSLGYTSMTDFDAYGISISIGYGFTYNEHWMLTTQLALNANQVIATNKTTDLQNNSTYTSKYSGLAIGTSGSVELMYKFNQLGVSFGGSINGRNTLAKITKGAEIYNDASYMLNAGVHFFLKTTPKENPPQTGNYNSSIMAK